MEAMSGNGVDARVRALADLIVRFGANVQPGQIVAIGSEPGKETLARAVAVSAYQAGAKFVDLSVFDVHVKHARMQYAAEDTLDFVPPWYGQRMKALGEHRCAAIALTGPVAPRIMDGIDPARARPRPAPAGSGVNRDRQPPHGELDGGAVPDSVVGRARAPGTAAAGRIRAALARRRPTSAGSTSPTRWQPGSSASATCCRSPESSTSYGSTRSASRDPAPS